MHFTVLLTCRSAFALRSSADKPGTLCPSDLERDRVRGQCRVSRGLRSKPCGRPSGRAGGQAGWGGLLHPQADVGAVTNVLLSSGRVT